jgi:hypothetical protein
LNIHWWKWNPWVIENNTLHDMAACLIVRENAQPGLVDVFVIGLQTLLNHKSLGLLDTRLV